VHNGILFSSYISVASRVASEQNRNRKRNRPKKYVPEWLVLFINDATMLFRIGTPLGLHKISSRKKISSKNLKFWSASLNNRIGTFEIF
jgi:hypothetical protein